MTWNDIFRRLDLLGQDIGHVITQAQFQKIPKRTQAYVRQQRCDVPPIDRNGMKANICSHYRLSSFYVHFINMNIQQIHADSTETA